MVARKKKGTFEKGDRLLFNTYYNSLVGSKDQGVIKLLTGEFRYPHSKPILNLKLMNLGCLRLPLPRRGGAISSSRSNGRMRFRGRTATTPVSQLHSRNLQNGYSIKRTCLLKIMGLFFRTSNTLSPSIELWPRQDGLRLNKLRSNISFPKVIGLGFCLIIFHSFVFELFWFINITEIGRNGVVQSVRVSQNFESLPKKDKLFPQKKIFNIKNGELASWLFSSDKASKLQSNDHSAKTSHPSSG